MKRKTLIILISALLVLVSVSAYPWVGDTHEAITKQVEEKNKILQAFLKNVGFRKGEETKFTLQSSGYFLPARFKSRAILFSDFDYTNSALDWLTIGSVEEDTPIITRAIHHFHDPTTLEGLS